MRRELTDDRLWAPGGFDASDVTFIIKKSLHVRESTSRQVTRQYFDLVTP